ncbi:ran-specific GTPase-activating protein-like [Diadema setosum]|uniref:ran-specific GTPase-activating protein-like n=1 Tax=Diadema setosum TaxID=31175 RepID=UPI003B3AADDE
MMADQPQQQQQQVEETPSPEIYFEPIVKLKPVEVKTLEEDEEELFKMRAKLYRYANEESPAEWKERGTGEIKLLKRKDDTEGKVRILMRRDKTFKICANHYISLTMDLKPNCGSDKAFVWHTQADFADEKPKPETLAIKFANAENAKKFKEKVDECQEELRKYNESDDEKEDDMPENASKETDKSKQEADDVAEKLGGMTVNDADKKDGSEKKDEAKEGAEKEKEKKEESTADPSKAGSEGKGDAKEES